MDEALARTAEDAIPKLTFNHSAGQASRVDVVRLSTLRGRQLDHSIFSPTRLEFHLVHFITEGRGAHFVDFEPIPVRAGDVLHIRPDQVHCFDRDSTHQASLLMFTPGTLERAHIPQPVRWQAGVVISPATADFRMLTDLLRLQESLDASSADIRPETVGPHLLATVLAGLADVVAARHRGIDPTAQRYENLVLDFESLLDQHHSEVRSASWYATRLGTTPRTLARACHQVRESSPKRLIDLRVILEAKRQLATSPATVEATGYALGFSEPTNFVKFFKRLVGSTPDAFRRSQVPGSA